MLVVIADLLTPQQVTYARQKLDGANWSDGAANAGSLAKRVKHNREIDRTNPVGQELGDIILGALGANTTFLSAAQPLRVIPPMFNRYEGGEHYGAHVDNAVMEIPGSGGAYLRTDLSMTVFLSEPHEYDGGELRVQDTYSNIAIKLPAGQAVLYNATSLHEVTPVTRGVRVSSILWMQSMVRDEAQRTMLYELDQTIISLRATSPDHPSVARFANHYHKLLQRWTEL